MEALLSVMSSNLESKAIKYANTFKHMLSSATEEVLLEEVARALGHLAGLPSSMQNNDYVEFELNRGIEVTKKHSTLAIYMPMNAFQICFCFCLFLSFVSMLLSVALSRRAAHPSPTSCLFHFERNISQHSISFLC